MKTTILASLLLTVSIPAFCQAPVVVSGNVHVASGGSMYSTGDVNLRAESSSSGIINNKGTLILKKGVNFYSNDASSAVLLNDYKNGGSVQLTAAAGQVSLHKAFKPGVWYYINLPFNVKISDLKDSQGNTAVYDSFRIRYYDAQSRADNGSTSGSSANWKQIPQTDYSTKSLNANQGYIMMVNPSLTTGLEVTFPATVDAALSTLYTGNKTIAMNNPTGPSVAQDQGWNYLGNPHTANFTLSMANTTYPGVIYYWDANIANYNFADMEIESLVIRPFTPVFMQAGRNGQSFQFKNDGLTLNAANPGLRSSSDNLSMIKLAINGTGTYSDACNISLGADYSDAFKIMEDGVKMFSPVEETAQLWSISKDGQALCVNKLTEQENTIIPLGVSLGKEDNYTISLKNIQGDFAQVMLVDKQNGVSTNLLDGDYTFPSGMLSSTDRFYIAISRVSTGISNATLDGQVMIYAQDGILKVDNIVAGDKVSVYDVSGRLVSSACSTTGSLSMPLAIKGILLVKVSGTNNASAKVKN